MARIEGTQSIPSELKELYDGALTPLMPNAAVRRRYPWQVKKMQEGGYKVGAAQKEQRQRWLAIRNKFTTLPQAERERWYAARPQWNSLLWYFNYFMMSGLNGVVDVNGMEGGVIRDINHYEFTIPATSPWEATVAIDTCDPTKTVPFFFGAGYREVLSGAVAVMYPHMKSLNSSQLVAQVSPGCDEATVFGVTVIEYI
ncbi:MAG: hypothetical protein WC433_07025 [Candidatus Omnitrophota bacterium]|jgi:hypothetical protein